MNPVKSHTSLTFFWQPIVKMPKHQLFIKVDYDGPKSDWEIIQRCTETPGNYTEFIDILHVEIKSNNEREVASVQKIHAKLRDFNGVLHFQDNQGANEAYQVRKLAGSFELQATSTISIDEYATFPTTAQCAKTMDTQTIQDILKTSQPIKRFVSVVPSAKVELTGTNFDINMLQ